jgi:DcmR-like sensory protein
MTTLAPLRARQSYRHEAFLWRTRADYVKGLVPFVLDGLDAGEAVLVGATLEHVGWLSEELGPRAAEVHFVDMSQLAHNPARIIPAVHELLGTFCGPGRPARGIGEPAWPDRGPEEVREAQLHEALLNLAIDPDLPFWLVCPYDAEHLDPALLVDAEHSHPVIATATSYAGSGRYRGHDHARALFTADLPDLGGPDADVRVAETSLDLAAEQVTLRATESDLLSDQVVVLNDVVRGLVVESVRRGAGTARLRLWDEPRELVCEVSDPTVVGDFLIGRRPPSTGRLDPVWFANQVCDLVQVRSNQHGTSVRVHVRK